MAHRIAAVTGRIATCLALGLAAPAWATSPVIVISLDGATPQLLEEMLADGTIPADRGLGLLVRSGTVARRNLTITPSLTAPGHVAIATGSSAARNDVVANSFHLCASPFSSNVSGFAAPIGGHAAGACGHDGQPTAEPLWIAARAAGKRVVTATWPGGDGADITVPGLPTGPIIDPASRRTVDYTVPFGAFAGLSARGFVLAASAFEDAPSATVERLAAAGRTSFSPVRQTAEPFERFEVGGASFSLQAAAFDSSDDGVVNYDSLVIFDTVRGIEAGPFALPATGPAWLDRDRRRSALFYLEGSASKAGTGFFLGRLAPDLSAIQLIRYSANAIPRNPAVLADVDDVNARVGFWAPQPDYRIPERLSAGLESFDDETLEAAYAELVKLFTDYQARLAVRALDSVPRVDLAMFYFEQPDGSAHQYLLTDPRQPTDIGQPDSIHEGQDPARRERYRDHIRRAYQAANEAVHRVLQRVGLDDGGRPRANVLVVSDHGFAPFHTAVDLPAWLQQKGFDPRRVRAVTSGPAANVYINLRGREPDGIVEPAEYADLQRRIVSALQELNDANPDYADAIHGRPGETGASAHSAHSAIVFGASGRGRGDREAKGQRVFQLVVARPDGEGGPAASPADFAKAPVNFAAPVTLATPVTFAAPVEASANGHRHHHEPLFGQDSGDVFALLALGYNFDGIQAPPVIRRGDSVVDTPVLSLPNFYGAHGYDPKLPQMSAIFIAAGPDVCPGRVIGRVRNIDIAPTVLGLLGVEPSRTVEGRRLDLCNEAAGGAEGTGADIDIDADAGPMGN